MNLSISHLLPEAFSNDSRVWVYQSDRLLTLTETLEIDIMLDLFVSSWQSHGDPVKGFATVFFGRFVVLMADETATGVSGCSTDSSVRLIKQIEQKFGVNLFNRQLLAFVVKENIELLPLSQLNYAVENGFISHTTPYFDNMVQTKKDLLDKWIIPTQNSWLKSHFTPMAKT
jgi:hypothetical protein